MLDKALANFAQIAETRCVSGDRTRSQPCWLWRLLVAPMGLSLLFNMQIKPGIEMVLDVLQADEVLKGADLDCRRADETISSTRKNTLWDC
ncbi:glycerate kinase [Vibrio chagasii]|nr:glycerate kinase [Vibrio chagasii]